MADVVVFGTNDFAEMVTVQLEADTPHRVVAYTVERSFLTDDRFFERDVLPFEDLPGILPPTRVSMFVAVGPSRINAVRARLMTEARNAGYSLISYVSPRARVDEGLELGDNCCLFDGVVIEPFCTVGEGCIFWSGASVAHHSQVGSYCFFAPSVAVSGRCTIGDRAFLGINATVRDHVRIGEGCIVGAGALIKKDTEDYSVYSAKRTELFASDSRSTGL